MARIIYALSGQGRGHTSRVIAISGELRARGHEVTFCCGGTAGDILLRRGEPVIQVPALRQIMESNELRLLQTLVRNRDAIGKQHAIITDLADTFAAYAPHLVIVDFEAFAPRAADRIGVPVVSFNHQQIITESRYSLPLKFRMDAVISELVVRMIAPKNPVLTIITSFFYPALRTPETTTYVPPIIRPAVQRLTPHRGEHVLVYYNHADGAEQVLRTLRKVDAPFIVYNFDHPRSGHPYPNIHFKDPCIDEFLNDLAGSRAVISTAGFTLMSEALYLGKPLLVAPNRGIFEQTLNALFLEREGLGVAVIDHPLTEHDVTHFLANHSAYERQLERLVTCGNKQGVARIEGILDGTVPVRLPVPEATLTLDAPYGVMT